MYRDILRGTLTFEKDAEARILYDECERQARILYDECQLEDNNRQAKFRALFQYSLVAQPENWIPTTSAPTAIESKQRHDVSESETDLSAEPPTHVAECDTHTFWTEVAKCIARCMRQQKWQRQRKRQRLCRKLQEKRNEEARRNVIIIE